ncbi:deacetylase Oant_2987-like [Hydractinia symbiolongicarpus]|uniref:deacetylase Oant_2987-like n=1 Tax=Hydractinia symbiolongicarpus TaxID=13093 RepID=UPI00254DAD82|nr:deacetylase Oant_2987-like [Hydractinia symbiolongicarpus]
MSQTLIKGAYVIDPAAGVEGVRDILIEKNIIKQVKDNITLLNNEDVQIYDGEGLIACPGLIDAHVHCFKYATQLGIDVDKRCLLKGTTSVIDAGSAGAANFLGLKKFIIEKSKTRVKALLHIANHGLTSAGCASIETGGECDSLNQVNVDQCVSCINTFPDDIIGIKVRLSESVCGDGKNELEAYKRALDVSKLTGKPLMTHHAFSSVPTHANHAENILGCPDSLNMGDIYTHMYHSYINKNREVNASFVAARNRGVLFDVGHGMGGFHWENAEICSKYNFWPDTISTDLHTLSCYDGPAYDLTTVMSKFLHLGMPLVKIIEAVTITPAKIMKMANVIGSLEEGKEADVTLLKISEKSYAMEDCHNNTREIKKRIKAIYVWKAGIKYDCET